MEIKKTETEIYVAKDGKEFRDMFSCLKHENYIRNLLEETINKLKDNNKNENDVLFVGFDTSDWTETKGRLFRVSWDKFKELAKDYLYDAGYDGRGINNSLVIVGDNWWLERVVDGSERWEFKQKPNIDDYEFTDDINNIKL